MGQVGLVILPCLANHVLQEGDDDDEGTGRSYMCRSYMCSKDIASLGDDVALPLARKNTYSSQHEIFQRGRGQRWNTNTTCTASLRRTLYSLTIDTESLFLAENEKSKKNIEKTYDVVLRRKIQRLTLEALRVESLDNNILCYLVTVGVAILNSAHRRFQCKNELRVWLKES
jgi:hypothetical protein